MQSRADKRDGERSRNLLSAVHHFNRRFNGFNFIHGVFQVNVLPVLTVCRPVTPALPVSSDPGVKHRRSHDIPLPPNWHALQRVGTGGIHKHIRSAIQRFYEAPPHPHTGLHFRSIQYDGKHKLTIKSQGNYTYCGGN